MLYSLRFAQPIIFFADTHDMIDSVQAYYHDYNTKKTICAWYNHMY